MQIAPVVLERTRVAKGEAPRGKPRVQNAHRLVVGMNREISEKSESMNVTDRIVLQHNGYIQVASVDTVRTRVRKGETPKSNPRAQNAHRLVVVTYKSEEKEQMSWGQRQLVSSLIEHFIIYPH